nr:MAG TPA: hypothetical protein [Caudoviricetes sp.]
MNSNWDYKFFSNIETIEFSITVIFWNLNSNLSS